MDRGHRDSIKLLIAREMGEDVPDTGSRRPKRVRPADTTPFLLLREVGDMLHAGRNTLLRMVSQGRFPNATKTGGHWRIPQSDVDALTGKPS